MRAARTIVALVIASALAGVGCGVGGGRPAPVDAGQRPDTSTPFGQQLGRTVRAATPPPAISGGTLVASTTTSLAFASDPDEDRVVVVDTSSFTRLGEVALAPHDEPGRAVLDAAGRLHVVLRGGGAIATLDVSTPSAPAIVERRAVCPAPRGIAYDDATDRLFVACAGGELVALPTTGSAIQTTQLPDDLRDVVVDGARLLVTRFRSAEVLVVDASTLAMSEEVALPEAVIGATMPRRASAGVAWRAVARPGGGALVLHQRAATSSIATGTPEAYGGASCDDAIVASALASVVPGETVPRAPSLSCTPLAVDVAVSPDGPRGLVASAGAAPLDRVQFRTFLRSSVEADGVGAVSTINAIDIAFTGRIVAVAYAQGGAMLAQTRAPAAVHVIVAGIDHAIALGGADHADTGLDLFHANVGAGVACASCHPEGGDDGHTWLFEDRRRGVGLTARRTIPLRGGVGATAPFHWDAQFPTMSELVSDVFGVRMGGGPVDADYEAAMLAWLDSVPELPARTVTDAAAVARGQALFESTEVGCTSCHAGPRGSNELTMNVGTDGAFQVPSLRGVAYRAPYLHDGRAATLSDRFGPSGGGDAHGHTSQLDAAQIADLVAYLHTL